MNFITSVVLIVTTLLNVKPAVAANSSGSPVKMGKSVSTSARTWTTITNYVLKMGFENSIKTPASRTLGYDSDEVPARVLRIKSSVSQDPTSSSYCNT